MMKKILAIALSLMLLIGAFAVTPVVSADGEIPSEFTQLSYEAQGTLFDYSKIDWSSFGTNLIKDPTVNNFVDDGNGGKVYGEYATTANENVNEDYWWDKYLDRTHGLVAWYPTISNCQAPQLLSPNKRGYVKPTGSLTDDGTGVIDATTNTSGDYALPLPNAKANTYYLLKFNVYCVNKGGNINLANGQTLLTATSNSSNKPLLNGWCLGPNRQTTAAVVFYTGTNVYNNLNLWVFSCPASFDDFGMYEITKEEYNTFKTAGKITGHEITDNVTVENDSVAVDKNYAEAGETVTVTVTPAEGKQLKAGSLKYIVAGKEYPITTRVGDESVSNVFTFTMPEEAVTVVAGFVDKAEVNVALLGAGLNVVDGALGQDMRFGTRAYRKAGDKTLFLCGNYVLHAQSDLGKAITANGGVVSEVLAEQLVSPAEGQIVKRVPTGVLNDRCTEYVDFTLRIAGVGADAYKNTEYMCVAYTIYKDDVTGELTTYYADACTRSYQGVVDALN